MSKEYDLLTSREKEVLDLLQNGMTNREIAQQLCISVETVKIHVKSILSKYNVNNRKKLIVKCHKNNPIEL